MSGRKHSIDLRQMKQLPATTVIANITDAAADAVHVTLADFIDALIAAGLEAGGDGGVTDGDKGDVVVASSGTVWTVPDLATITTALSGKAATSHSHVEGDVTGLTAALAGKASSSHAHAQSDVTGLVAALALLATLLSPTFTGTPSAPTASGDTNTTQLATTAFVQLAAIYYGHLG